MQEHDAPIDFAKLAQKHKTNEQKMLEALEAIRTDIREMLHLLLAELPLNALKPASTEQSVGTQPAATAATGQAPSKKMFVPKVRR